MTSAESLLFRFIIYIPRVFFSVSVPEIKMVCHAQFAEALAAPPVANRISAQRAPAVLLQQPRAFLLYHVLWPFDRI